MVTPDELERHVIRLTREVREARERERILQLIIGVLIVLCVLIAAIGWADADEANGPRRIDFGPRLNSLVHCESTGYADAINSSSGAAGLFQFLPTSWDAIARLYDKPHLVGVHPTEATLAQQYRQARRYIDHAGFTPWVCSPYGNTLPVTVSGDRPTKAPRKCRKNLETKWNVPAKQARKICRS